MTSSLVDFSNDIAQTVERVGSFVIGVVEGGREGVSGILWRPDLGVTAEHTIRGQGEVTVILPSGEKTKATIAGRDPGTDVAIVKLSGTSVSAPIADESQTRVGEVVLSVGRRSKEGLATTHGIVSAIGGPWRTWQGARVDRWLRLDLIPFPGFSGGPVVNARGEVLGMAVSGPRRSVVTISASTVNSVVEQLHRRGRITRGYLGVGVQPVLLPEALSRSVGTSHHRGLLIMTVAPGSSAESSGLLLGDVIITVAGSAVRTPSELQPVLDAENVGKSVTFEVIRGGKLVTLAVTIGEKAGAQG